MIDEYLNNYYYISTQLKMDSTLNISRSLDNSLSMINQSISAKDSLDLSGKMLDRYFAADDSFPTLLDKMQITKTDSTSSQ